MPSRHNMFFRSGAALTAGCVWLGSAVAQPAANTGAAAAEGERDSSTQSADSNGLTFSLTPKAEHTFSADLRDSDAKVGVTRAGLDLNIGAPLGDRARLRFAVETEASWYDFEDSASLLPSGKEPIDDAYLVRLSPGIAYSLSERWSLLGGAIVEFGGESDVDVGDAVTYGGYGGVGYKVSDALSLTFGAIVKSRLEDDTLVVPLLGLRWQIDDRLSLQSEQLGLRFVGRIDERWSVSIFGRYEIRDFRLADDGAVPGGVLEDSRVPVGVSVTWTPTERFSLTLSGGAVVWQRFEFNDNAGERVESVRGEPAPFVGIKGEINF